MDLETLLDRLASPDPAERDESAYPELAGRIRRGELDHRLVFLGDTMAARFGHPEIQARTFAPLILAVLVERDPAGPDLRRWRDAFRAWWLAEQDLRGWDDRRGWLHAVAHGADLAGALGAAPRLTPEEAAGMLGTIAERVTAPTGYRYAHMEEDRIARAIGRILGRPDLDERAATGWLDAVDRQFAEVVAGPLPVPVANTLAVLRAAYVLVDRGDARHRVAVTDAIADRLHQAFPDYPSSRSPSVAR